MSGTVKPYSLDSVLRWRSQWVGHSTPDRRTGETRVRPLLGTGPGTPPPSWSTVHGPCRTQGEVQEREWEAQGSRLDPGLEVGSLYPGSLVDPTR